MNCVCVPPKPAVVKVSQNVKSGGKEFFCCPINACGFFSWVGQDMPMSLAFGRNKQSNAGKSSSYNNGSNSSPQKTNGKHDAKVMVHEIQEGPPVVIWLSLQCPSTPVVNDLFSRLPAAQCKFSNTLKMWLFSYDLYERVIEEFHTPPFESIKPPELPRFLAKGLASYQKRINKLNCAREPVLRLGEQVLSKLLPFQLEAVKFVVRRGGRAMLGDEMGCGKTLQAIAIMMHYRALWPALVVVPSSLIKQWPDEIRKYAGDLVSDGDIRIVGKSSDVGTALITIITYKVMDNLVASKLLTPDQFGVVVADESHNLKNKESSRSQAIIPFLRKATVALCMTGTPEVNRPVELYSQLNGILPDVFNDYNAFVYRYCDAKPNKSLPGLNVSGHSNDKELNTILCGLAMVRRSKDEVLTDLPEKRRELRYVEPDPVHVPEIKRITGRSKQLEELIANGAGKDPSEIQAWSNEKQQLLTALYTATGNSKIPAIKEELVKLIEESRAERGIIAAERASAALAARTAKQSAAAAGQHTQEDSSAEEDDGMDADADACSVHTVDSDSTQVLAASDCEYVPSSKALRLLGSSHGSADNKHKCAATGQASQQPTGKQASAPVLMELEDDIMTSKVHDLCDTEDESDHHHKRQKKNNGSHAAAVWEDDEGCDYNLSDIKASSLRHSKQRAGDCSDADDDNVCGLFDKHKRNTAKAKTATKSSAKSKVVVVNKGSKDKNGTKESSSSAEEDTAVCSVGQKIIVFFHHKMVLSAIEDALTELQVKFIKIDGATPQGKRAKLIDQFQNDNVTDVALLSITACGVGLNLTRANVALFGELNWSLGVVLQAEDRIHRLGQTAKEVRIIYMIARNTVDEIVWEQIQRKHQVVGATVGTSGARSYSGGMKINSDRQDSNGGNQMDLHSYALAAAAKKAEDEEVLAAITAYTNRATAPSASATVASAVATNTAMPTPSNYNQQGSSYQGSYGVPSAQSYGISAPTHGSIAPASLAPPYQQQMRGAQAQGSSSSYAGALSTSIGSSLPAAPSMGVRAASYPSVAPSGYGAPSNTSGAGGYRAPIAAQHITPPLPPTGPFTSAVAQRSGVAQSSVGVPLYGNTEEFAYSAASQASEATSGESRGSDNNPNKQSAPPVPPVGNFPPQRSVNTVPQVSLPPNPPANFLSSGSVPLTRPHETPVTSNSNVSVSKAPLAPEVLARMEANRLAAQAKLAKRREEQLQVQVPAGAASSSSSAGPVVPSNHATLPPQQAQQAPQAQVSMSAISAMPHGSPHKPLQTAQTYPSHALGGSPALGAALQNRQPTANIPPGIISNVSPTVRPTNYSAGPLGGGPAHVFSTGRGSTLTVSEAQLRQANALLATAQPAPGIAPASITRVGGVMVATPSYHVPSKPVAIPNPAGATTSGAPPAVPPTATATASTGAINMPPPVNAQGLSAATMYFDGGALGNPGKAGAGYQIFAQNGRTIKESAVKMAGVCTNNQAEYVGLIHGMTAALHCGVQDLVTYGDSEIVIKQMTGLYQVKNPTLQGMHQRAQALRSRFRRVQFQWIPRDKNGGADALSKLAMHHSEQVNEAADWFSSAN